MKTAIKIIVVLFILVVIGIVGITFLALGQIDKIAKASIEYGGTYAMGVTTTVDEVDVAITKGTVEMAGLNIDNPDGFDTGHFFTLASSNASIDLESLNADTFIVPEVRLSGIDVVLDKGQDPSNYNQILENLARFESEESDPADAEKAGKDVIIKSLILEDINIHVANMPGVSLLAGDVAINIPSIELQNVGEKESMKAGDIFDLVVKTVLAAAVDAGGGIIPGDVLGELGNGLSGLTSLGDLGIEAISDLDLDGAMGQVSEQVNEALDDLSKQGEEVQEQVEDVVDDLENTVDDAADKLKGIFGGKKDDP
jgi:hypothetical protein